MDKVLADIDDALLDAEKAYFDYLSYTHPDFDPSEERRRFRALRKLIDLWNEAAGPF